MVVSVALKSSKQLRLAITTVQIAHRSETLQADSAVVQAFNGDARGELAEVWWRMEGEGVEVGES